MIVLYVFDAHVAEIVDDGVHTYAGEAITGPAEAVGEVDWHVGKQDGLYGCSSYEVGQRGELWCRAALMQTWYRVQCQVVCKVFLYASDRN